MADGPRLIKEVTEQEPSFKADWPNLPFVPLTDVYSYLSRKDQYSMSQVCKNWSEGFSSRYLWESFVFALTENESSEDLWYLMKSVEDNSDVLEHVSISYCLATDYEQPNKRWIKQFSMLMDILTRKAQLYSVEFNSFGDLSHSIDEPTNQKVCRIIADFFESQRHLEKVSLSEFFSEHQDWINLLNKLVENSGKFLRQIVMFRIYLDPQPDIEKQEQILSTLLGLKKLETLSIDYSLILGRDADPSVVIETLKNYKKQVTLKLFLCLCTFQGFKILESKQWKDLREANKLLKVEVDIYAESNFRGQSYSALVKHMPVTNLRFRITKFSSLENIVDFFNHPLVCYTYEHLLGCQLHFDESVTVFPEPLTRFLTSCRKLNKVIMEMVYPVNDLNVLLESLAQNPPNSLKKFALIISQIGNEENKTMLEGLTSRFEEKLKLKVKLLL